MTTVRADRQALEEFAQRLRDFDQTTAQSLQTLAAAWNEVKGHWPDAVQQRFAEMFEEFTPWIDRYVAASQEYEMFMSQKIQALRDYEG